MGFLQDGNCKEKRRGKSWDVGLKQNPKAEPASFFCFDFSLPPANPALCQGVCHIQIRGIIHYLLQYSNIYGTGFS